MKFNYTIKDYLKWCNLNKLKPTRYDTLKIFKRITLY